MNMSSSIIPFAPISRIDSFPMTGIRQRLGVCLGVSILGIIGSSLLQAEGAGKHPVAAPAFVQATDFTVSGVIAALKSGSISNLRPYTETYNLGATGLRGWIYTKAANSLDSQQGRTTTAARQILVTHVGAKSPADGIMQVDDVIIGVGAAPFTFDARQSMAKAIQEAEMESNAGVLKLAVWRAGKTQELQLKLRVMGTYSTTAPYDCPKSKRIFEDACKALEQEPLENNWHGAVNGLSLLATGDAKHLPKCREFAHKLGPSTLKLELKDGSVVWEWGYRNLFLCEYYLITRDKEVLHAINEYTITLAKGQSMYGTFGHGISGLTPAGKLHGSIPPYGPVNAAGLIGNLAIVMGRKCGVKHPEIDPAIDRAAKFFGYYVDKGAIPYGEHEAWASHENNGKNSMAAVMFAVQDNRIKESQYFSKMVTASYQNREYGHTGQGFSYLWGAMGANAGGPDALAAFFGHASWHFDLVRRCDGSFTYDGSEQYGGGKTDDNTYFGKSGYNGLSPTASYVLTYSAHLKNLCITGKDANPAKWLSKKDVAEAIASGSFDLDRQTLSVEELMTALGDWSPIARGWAAEEISKRPNCKEFTPQLITMAESSDARKRLGAVEAFSYIQTPDALPVLVRALSHEDRGLRFKAAQALKKMGGQAKSVAPEILSAVVKTAEPLQPINWADPIQITQGQLAAALFQTPLKDALQVADRKQVRQAIKVFSRNADGMARATLRGYFESQLTLEDVEALAPDILAAIEIRCPADTMFGCEIRMGGLRALTKYHFVEAIAAGVTLAKTQGGHGSQKRTLEIMNEITSFGSAARSAIPGLKEVIVVFNTQCKNNEFPSGELNEQRISAVNNAIQTINQSNSRPELRRIKNITR